MPEFRSESPVGPIRQVQELANEHRAGWPYYYFEHKKQRLSFKSPFSAGSTWTVLELVSKLKGCGWTFGPGQDPGWAKMSVAGVRAERNCRAHPQGKCDRRHRNEPYGNPSANHFSTRSLIRLCGMTLNVVGATGFRLGVEPFFDGFDASASMGPFVTPSFRPPRGPFS